MILDLYTKNKVFNLLISPNLKTYLFGTDSKVLKFNKVHIKTHRRSGLLISEFALQKLFRYLLNFAGMIRQNFVSPKPRLLSHSLESTFIELFYRYAIIICTGVCEQSERKY